MAENAEPGPSRSVSHREYIEVVPQHAVFFFVVLIFFSPPSSSPLLF